MFGGGGLALNLVGATNPIAVIEKELTLFWVRLESLSCLVDRIEDLRRFENLFIVLAFAWNKIWKVDFVFPSNS